MDPALGRLAEACRNPKDLRRLFRARLNFFSALLFVALDSILLYDARQGVKSRKRQGGFQRSNPNFCDILSQQRLTIIVLPGFDKIVEERILRAQRQGDFENLPGAGKPLCFGDDAYVPEELRLAYKILKNAGCVPPEVELRKQIVQTEDLLAGMEGSAEKYRVIKKLNFLIMKLNTMRRTHLSRETPQHYLDKLAQRCAPGGGI